MIKQFLVSIPGKRLRIVLAMFDRHLYARLHIGIMLQSQSEKPKQSFWPGKHTY